MKSLIFLLILLAGFFNSYAGNNQYFIENKGQWSDEVRYLAKINGMNAWITNDGIVYDFYKIEVSDSNKTAFFPSSAWEKVENKIPDRTIKGHVVKMRFVKSKLSESMKLSESSGLEFQGIKKSESYYNFFIGNDSTKWVGHVPLYEEIKVTNTIPGVNTRYYFDNGNIRYDFIIEPGSDISQLKMNFDFGNEPKFNCNLNSNGELVLETSIGEMYQGKIYAYQLVHGMKKEVECKFIINTDNSIGFAVGDYDTKKQLVIDPLIYSTYIGNQSYVNGIVIDSDKNTYITGSATSSNYPTTTGAYDESFNVLDDVFASKFSTDGSTLIWSTFLGGRDFELSFCITLDNSNNVCIAGLTQSSDFPVTNGAYDLSKDHSSGQDAFVSKLSSDGSSLLWSTFLGGNDIERVYDIAHDISNNVYVTGITRSPFFPTTSGVYDRTWNGSLDVFVSKLSADGSSLIWSTYLGGSDFDEVGFFNWGDGVKCMFLDASNNVYISGNTQSSNFPTTSGAHDRSFNGGRDIFVTKINSDGSSLLWSTFIGGTNNDESHGITHDGSNNIYMTGYTTSSNYPITSGVLDETYNGSNDVFVSKLSSDGTTILWSTFIGGSKNEMAYGICLDVSDDVYIGGLAYSSDYPITKGAFDETMSGLTDAFISKLISSGTTLAWSSFFGGSNNDNIHCILIDTSDCFYVGGTTTSANFPVTSGAYDETYNGSEGVFLSKLLTTNITTENISQNSFCAGENMQIPFTCYKTYNAGNIFSAQLSDASGNFSSWTQIGTLTSTGSGSINAIIPRYVQPGSGYRIRVVASSPSDEGTNNGSNITINSLPTPAIISGDYTTCEYDKGIYICNNDINVNYKWKATGGNIAGKDNCDTVYVNWNSAGSGTVTLIQSNKTTGCSDSTFEIITIGTMSTPSLFSGDYTPCDNDKQIYICNSDENVNYKWKARGGNINGKDNNDTVYVDWDTIGSATLTIIQTNKISNCKDSLVMDVMVYEKPKPEIEGIADVCLNEITYYKSNFDVNFKNEWFVENGNIMIKENENIAVKWNNLGESKVKIIQTNIETGCRDSSEFSVMVYANPVAQLLNGKYVVNENQEETYTALKVNPVGIDWQIKGGQIININDNSLTVKWGNAGNGEILLIVIDSISGCADTLIKNIKIISDKGIYILGELKVCSGYFHEYRTSKPENFELEWIVENAVITEGITDSIVHVKWGDAGLGKIKVVKTDIQNKFKDSLEYEVLIDSLPAISFKNLPEVCRNDEPFKLDCAFPEGGNYSGEGVEANIFYPDIAGPGNIKIRYIYTDMNYCTNDDSTTIKVLPAYGKPFISQIKDTLITSEGFKYQWFFEGIIIDGAVNRTYQPQKEGNYTVQMTGGNGCKSKMSEPYNFEFTDVEDNLKRIKGITIYPNPANDILNIEINDRSIIWEYKSVEIYDVLGKRLLSKDLNSNLYGYDKPMRIDISMINDGFYYIVLSGLDNVISSKFSVIK